MEVKKLDPTILCQIGINQIIAGYLYHDGEIKHVPKILRKVAEDYEANIKRAE